VVVADGNRRQAFVSSRPRGNRGPVLRADQDVSQDGTMLDPFAARDPRTQTIALQEGAQLSAPLSPQLTQVPEHRPFAAVDGDLRTAWLADRALARERHALTLTFAGGRDVPWVDVVPFSNAFGRVEAVRVNGRPYDVRPGVNRLRVGLRDVTELTVAMARVVGPRRRSSGAGGIRELRVPGVRIREILRPPVVAEEALREADLRRSRLTYLLARQTADAPQRAAPLAGNEQGGDRRDAGDAEQAIERQIAPPDRRTWTAEAWVRAAPGARDSALDRLAGVRGDLRADSSSRWDGLPRYRASGAFDGGPRGWIGQWIPGRPAWLGFAGGKTTLRDLRLEPVAARVRRPTRVRLDADGRRGPEAAVAPDGRVALPRPVTGRSFRLHVLEAAFPPGTPARARRRRAVGIGELRAAGVERLRVPGTGALRTACGAVGVEARVELRRAAGAQGAATGEAPGPGEIAARALLGRLRLEVRADLRAFDAGRELRARPCGAPLDLPAGPLELRATGDVVRADHLRLTSRAASPAPARPPAGATRAGVLEPGARRDASARVDRPAWLVHGQSFSRGWRATCDGRDLGPPVPLQGHANAWPLDAPGCTDLDVAFAPDRTIRVASLVSLASAPVLLALVAWPALARRRRQEIRAPAGSGPRARAAPADLPDPDRDARAGRGLPLRTALLAGAGAAAVAGFVFALRVGVLAGPVVAPRPVARDPVPPARSRRRRAARPRRPRLYLLFPAPQPRGLLDLLRHGAPRRPLGHRGGRAGARHGARLQRRSLSMARARSRCPSSRASGRSRATMRSFTARFRRTTRAAGGWRATSPRPAPRARTHSASEPVAAPRSASPGRRRPSAGAPRSRRRRRTRRARAGRPPGATFAPQSRRSASAGP
jgi:hypothetical protein